MSSEALDRLDKKLQRIQGDLIRRIASVESSLSKFSSLEDDMVQVKMDLVRALAPKEPIILQDDVDRWNANCDKTQKLEDLLNQLQRDMANLDGPKIKADILQLFKIQNNIVSKEALADLSEQVRRIKESIGDIQHDIE